jgi:hypothetical protein
MGTVIVKNNIFTTMLLIIVTVIKIRFYLWQFCEKY